VNTETDDLLHAKLNTETGQIGWVELQRHFARGAVITLDQAMDLVAVAVAVSRDERAQVAAWIAAGQVRHASDADALRWHERQSRFWAVVAAPWVLVQEIPTQAQA